MPESENHLKPIAPKAGTARRFMLLIRTNWISSFGAALVFLAGLAIATLVFMQFTGRSAGPYDAILTFFLLPALGVIGLLLIPFGLLLHRKRLKHRLEELADKPLYLARAVVILTIVNFAGILIVGQEGYHYVSSNGFCGKTCHDIMTPEYTTFQDSVHANLECADCHIGPGLSSQIKAKLNGINQLVETIKGFHRAIPTPVHQLRPAKEICGVCHWGNRYVNSDMLVRTRFREDKANTPYTNVALLRIGGTHPTGMATGIHWHTNPKVQVEFISRDEKRMDVVWVHSRREDGSEKTFTLEGIDAANPPEGHKRAMDCTDCHNRIGHDFQNPHDAVDAAMTAGLIPRDLPYVKKLSLEVLQMERARAAADEGIRTTLTKRYEELAKDPSADFQLDDAMRPEDRTDRDRARQDLEAQRLSRSRRVVELVPLARDPLRLLPLSRSRQDVP